MKNKEVEHNFIAALVDTLRFLRAKKILIPISLDLIFFLLFGFIMAGFIEKISELLSALGFIVINLADSAQSILISGADILKAEPAFTYVKGIILLLIMLIVAIFMLFSLFQAYSFYYCFNMSEKLNVPKYKFVNRFFLVNLVFLIPILFYQGISFLILFMETSSSRFNIGTSFSASKMIIAMYLFLLAYFLILSYCVIPYSIAKNWSLWKLLKSSSVLGITNFLSYAPSILLVVLILVFIQYINSLTTIYYAKLIFELIIALPALILIKIYIYKIVNLKKYL